MEEVELEDLVEFSKTIKVLYVEGEYELRESAYGVFKIFFDEIDTAQNGAEGFERFQNSKYNLIITEVNMPIMNGIDMIKKIRKISKDITILIISSNDDKDHFMDLIRLGIDGYILKPVKVQQFVEVLNKVIQKFKNKQELYEYKLYLEDIVNKRTSDLIKTNKKLQQKEIQLNLLNESLQKRVKVEVEKNLQKEKQLFQQSKLASMGEMIGNIAHQWRQPLSVISTCVTGLQMKQEMGLLENSDVSSACEAINENASYLSNTIDDFRKFIQGNSAKHRFYLNEAVSSLLNLVATSIKAKQILVVNNIKTSCQINGYENELIQCLLNIVNNSIDIISEKNQTEKKIIYIDYKINTEEIEITIQDNGGGIDDSIIDKVFEPYFTTKHPSQGIGLSLSIAYKLVVEGMSGNLRVENNTFNIDNEEYFGAKFIITLPLD